MGVGDENLITTLKQQDKVEKELLHSKQRRRRGGIYTFVPYTNACITPAFKEANLLAQLQTLQSPALDQEQAVTPAGLSQPRSWAYKHATKLSKLSSSFR